MKGRQDDLFQFYEDLFTDGDLRYYSPDITRRFLRAICRESGVPAGGRVLDVGCATGYYSGIFQQLGYRVTGVDFSPTAIGKARACHANVCFEVQDARALEFGDKRFDLVFLSGCSILNTVDIGDIRDLVIRLMQFVAPGGTLVLISSSTLADERTTDSTWISHSWKDINRYIPAGEWRVRGPWLSHFRLIAARPFAMPPLAALPLSALPALSMNPLTTLLLRILPGRLPRMVVYLIEK